MKDSLNRIEATLKDHIEKDKTWKTQAEEMLTSRDMLVRRLREGVEFFQFLRKREDMIVS